MNLGGSRSWSLAGRLAGIFALSITPLASFFAYDLASRYAEQTREASQHTAEVTRGLAHQHEALIVNARNLLGAIALIPEIRQANRGQCRRILLNFLDADSPYLDLTLSGADGVMRCSARFIDQPLEAAKLPYFQKVLATHRFSVGGVQVGRVTGIPIIVFGYPVFDERGTLQVVLGAGVPLSFLGRALNDNRLPEHSVVALTGGDGKAIARIPALHGAPSPPPRALLEAIQSGAGEGSFEAVGSDGIARLNTYTRFNYEGSDLYFSAGVPRESVYGPVVRRLELYAATIAAAVLLVVLVAWRFGRDYLIAPLANLRDAAVRFGEGNLARARTQGDPFARPRNSPTPSTTWPAPSRSRCAESGA